MKCIYNENLMWSKNVSLEMQYREIFLYETGCNFDVVAENVVQLTTLIVEVFESVKSTLLDIFKQMTHAMKQICEVHSGYIEKEKPKMPKIDFNKRPVEIPMVSQVLDRRPRVSHTRDQL